jgi:hypothetical protein
MQQIWSLFDHLVGAGEQRRRLAQSRGFIVEEALALGV